MNQSSKIPSLHGLLARIVMKRHEALESSPLSSDHVELIRIVARA